MQLSWTLTNLRNTEVLSFKTIAIRENPFARARSCRKFSTFLLQNSHRYDCLAKFSQYQSHHYVLEQKRVNYLIGSGHFMKYFRIEPFVDYLPISRKGSWRRRGCIWPRMRCRWSPEAFWTGDSAEVVQLQVILDFRDTLKSSSEITNTCLSVGPVGYFLH